MHENFSQIFTFLFPKFALCLIINSAHMEIVLLILTVLVIFSCLSAWFNAAELDTDDENF